MLSAKLDCQDYSTLIRQRYIDPIVRGECAFAYIAPFCFLGAGFPVNWRGKRVRSIFTHEVALLFFSTRGLTELMSSSVTTIR